MDIKQAYHNIPVALEDWHLLGLQWNGHACVETVLSFGLRSAPVLFNEIVECPLVGHETEW